MAERLRVKSQEEKDESMRARTARKEYRFWLRRTARTYLRAKRASSSIRFGGPDFNASGAFIDDVYLLLNKLRRFEKESRHMDPYESFAPKRVEIAIAARRKLDASVDKLSRKIEDRREYC